MLLWLRNKLTHSALLMSFCISARPLHDYYSVLKTGCWQAPVIGCLLLPWACKHTMQAGWAAWYANLQQWLAMKKSLEIMICFNIRAGQVVYISTFSLNLNLLIQRWFVVIGQDGPVVTLAMVGLYTKVLLFSAFLGILHLYRYGCCFVGLCIVII